MKACVNCFGAWFAVLAIVGVGEALGADAPASDESTKPAAEAEKKDAPPADSVKNRWGEAFTRSAVEPAPRSGDWTKRHEGLNGLAKQGNYELVFIGDSITEGWAGSGKAVWDKYYRPRNALNLGVGGDRTQNVLWRLQNGNLEGLRPKLAVVTIGTNNSNNQDNTAEEIGDGIKAIVAEVRKRLPETKILLLAAFPRNEKPDAQREKNAKASEIASKLADEKMVFYMDIGPKFLEADGTLSRSIMPDLLHLNRKGYEIWAEAIEGKVAELMGES